VKLFLDDMRVAPEGWHLVKTANACTAWMAAGYPVEAISLDYDLGTNETGMAVIWWMIRHAVWPPHIYLHTMNPVGRDHMLWLLDDHAPKGVQVHR